MTRSPGADTNPSTSTSHSAGKGPVVITGIGLVTSQGVGQQVHAELLTSAAPPEPVLDSTSFQPYSVHPMPQIDWSSQIPRRGDQRQMENWQRLGVFAAGLALDDAGLKEDADACASMDMIVAAGGGERDIAVDTLIIEEGRNRDDRDVLLNEKLTTELRPTLFLAQLSNLLAGNISIVHKVTGSSRTVMGEEGAGISAIETAHARIASGQSTHCLVGGAFVAERIDILLLIEAIQGLEVRSDRPFWARTGPGGMHLGSVGAFLVLESLSHAKARGAKIYATLDSVAGDRGGRGLNVFETRLGQLADQISQGETSLEDPDHTVIFSGACGLPDLSQRERAFLEKRFYGAGLRTYGSLFGHSLEAQFPLGLALAALALKSGMPVCMLAKYEGLLIPQERASQPIDAPGQAPKSAPRSAIVTTVGHARGEGFARLSATG